MIQCRNLSKEENKIEDLQIMPWSTNMGRKNTNKEKLKVAEIKKINKNFTMRF